MEDGIRLQKYLAQAGVASRRKAEELIRDGHVSVNNFITTEMGTRIYPDDIIKVDDRRIIPEEKKVYLALHKPEGYVTTARDQFARPAVVDLLEGIRERVYPVGRLDYDTSGLLLLTNDGDFTYRLTHPRHEIDKVYMAEVSGVPSAGEIDRFKRGLNIEDYITAPAKLEILQRSDKSSVLKITIHEGRNRQVRKMCAAIGQPVRKLKRIQIGNLSLGDLPEGHWRMLSGEEVKTLYES